MERRIHVEEWRRVGPKRWEEEKLTLMMFEKVI